ncbi:transcriptional regulator, TetR family [Streptoalloteichus tenebrarius]|uniref:Transcriptional regulator, TetR family n=1 Tax=Streptoalloteichus tenebrarius (strain ATCC 17920 / DSM 40477 / JCM 4838 / CBS 697.72 / NBRC 16177 / NCIMB 11028 / NRRL B-12390 / A12253. 1 / ISP 5477) TaxID=1933 RepID=A0ABT1HV02_STRSD|nr:TetR/AcrR family transcriptional regulator [Streptoalloteichus tenebrarius]MCP2259250.1 transcriptional regulator, TetR family [Streptoalloteichus tenebrarius]BFE99008.1 TetR family transcriptional regulator C-terminal domain-containing protein [Streptoalloteichus tenebrarius]
MPKIVDHEERRWELVRATWAVIRERGVHGASVRAVARQAGWSASSVQYYFSTQAELLLFALRAISEAGERRVCSPDLPTDPRARGLAQLERLLPLDPDAQVATEIWVAFLSLVLVDPEARALHSADNLRVACLCREVLDTMSSAGQISPDVDLDLEASLLQALFDGIAVHAVTDPERMPPARIRQLLKYHLNRLRATPSPERE